MTDLSRMRVSDAEREDVVTLLQQATAEGRLNLDELGERVSAAYASVTQADLDLLVDDLPARPIEPEPAEPEPVPSAASGPMAFLILAMGVASIPLAFVSALGPALGVVTVILAVLTLSMRRETSRINRAAILGGVVAGLMTPVFFLFLLLTLAT